MHGEKCFAEMWRTFEVAQQMRHEVSRIRVTSVLVGIELFPGSRLLPVLKDNNFISAKHGKGTGDGADKMSLQVGSFAIILPGRANESVY